MCVCVYFVFSGHFFPFLLPIFGFRVYPPTQTLRKRRKKKTSPKREENRREKKFSDSKITHAYHADQLTIPDYEKSMCTAVFCSMRYKRIRTYIAYTYDIGVKDVLNVPVSEWVTSWVDCMFRISQLVNYGANSILVPVWKREREREDREEDEKNMLINSFNPTTAIDLNTFNLDLIKVSMLFDFWGLTSNLR